MSALLPTLPATAPALSRSEDDTVGLHIGALEVDGFFPEGNLIGAKLLMVCLEEALDADLLQTEKSFHFGYLNDLTALFHTRDSRAAVDMLHATLP